MIIFLLSASVIYERILAEELSDCGYDYASQGLTYVVIGDESTIQLMRELVRRNLAAKVKYAHYTNFYPLDLYQSLHKSKGLSNKSGEK